MYIFMHNSYVLIIKEPLYAAALTVKVSISGSQTTAGTTGTMVGTQASVIIVKLIYATCGCCPLLSTFDQF